MTPKEAIKAYQEAEAEWWTLQNRTITKEEAERAEYLWRFMTTFPCPVWTLPYPEVGGRIHDEPEGDTSIEN